VAEQLSSKAQDVQDEQEDADAETAEAKEDWPASQQGTAAFASSSNASAGAAAPSSLDQMTDIQLGDEERALLLTAVETQRDLDKVSLCSRWCCNPAGG